MIGLLVLFINSLAQLLVLLVIVSVILSYFMDPYHPIRRGIDSVVQPLLDPIRRVVPNIGMLDLSPLVLIILIQVVANLLIRLLLTLI
ncbi:MAG TPA: YggT family protein [Anaerolineales bacterium]|nr:YggT family protein [Anaerolineales bacterium]